MSEAKQKARSVEKSPKRSKMREAKLRVKNQNEMY